MKDLLPYLAGAASAFVVQFLIQVYVVPLTETRRRRMERWEKDALDLGELLNTTISDAAREAMGSQFRVRLTQRMVGSPDISQEYVERELGHWLPTARSAWRALDDLVTSRAAWLLNRIAIYRASDKVVESVQASLRYQLHIMKSSADEWRELSDDDFDAWWKTERELRTELNSRVRALSWDRHPLRISWRLRGERLRYKARRRLGKIRRKPIVPEPAAAGPEQSAAAES